MQRALILDYLRHNGYASTARAFLRDSAIKHLDADGDEMMSEFTPPSQQDATDDSVLSETLEEDLIQTEHRRGSYVLTTTLFATFSWMLLL